MTQLSVQMNIHSFRFFRECALESSFLFWGVRGSLIKMVFSPEPDNLWEKVVRRALRALETKAARFCFKQSLTIMFFWFATGVGPLWTVSNSVTDTGQPTFSLRSSIIFVHFSTWHTAIPPISTLFKREYCSSWDTKWQSISALSKVFVLSGQAYVFCFHSV